MKIVKNLSVLVPIDGNSLNNSVKPDQKTEFTKIAVYPFDPDVRINIKKENSPDFFSEPIPLILLKEGDSSQFSIQGFIVGANQNVYVNLYNTSQTEDKEVFIAFFGDTGENDESDS